jgi:hypothetical protein
MKIVDNCKGFITQDLYSRPIFRLDYSNYNRYYSLNYSVLPDESKGIIDSFNLIKPLQKIRKSALLKGPYFRLDEI